jgi:hypothetical protein
MKKLKPLKRLRPIRPIKPITPIRPIAPMKPIADVVSRAFRFGLLAPERGTRARCFVFSSNPTVCPLCKVDVPANTEHTCSKRDLRSA